MDPAGVSPAPIRDATTAELVKISPILDGFSLRSGNHVNWIVHQIFDDRAMTIEQQLALMRHLAQDISRNETYLRPNDFNIMLEFLCRRKCIKSDALIAPLLREIHFPERTEWNDLYSIVEKIVTFILRRRKPARRPNSRKRVRKAQ